MIKNILNVEGVKKLSRFQQSKINGGLDDCKSGQVSTPEKPCRRRIKPSNA